MGMKGKVTMSKDVLGIIESMANIVDILIRKLNKEQISQSESVF